MSSLSLPSFSGRNHFVLTTFSCHWHTVQNGQDICRNNRKHILGLIYVFFTSFYRMVPYTHRLHTSDLVNIQYVGHKCGP